MAVRECNVELTTLFVEKETNIRNRQRRVQRVSVSCRVHAQHVKGQAYKRGFGPAVCHMTHEHSMLMSYVCVLCVRADKQDESNK